LDELVGETVLPCWRQLSSSDSRDTGLRFLKRRPPRTSSSEGRRDRELIVAGGLNINPVWIRRRHEHSSSMAAVPACRGGQSPPPIGNGGRSRRIGVEMLISNRSPMRWPKLVDRFHLPSAVCPPSVFGATPSGRVWQELEALDGPGAQNFMTHNPHRGGRNWSAGFAFRPTFVRLPAAFSTFAPPSEHPLALRRELSGPLRLPSAFAVRRGPPCLRDDALPRPLTCALFAIRPAHFS